MTTTTKTTNINETVQELRTLLQEKKAREQELVEHVLNNSFLVLESLDEIPQEYLKVDLAVTKEKFPKTRSFLDERWERLARVSENSQQFETTEALSSLMRGLYLVSHKGRKETLSESTEKVLPLVVPEKLSAELTEELSSLSTVKPIKRVPVSLTEAQNIVLTEAFTDLFKGDSENTKQFTNSMNQIRNLAQMGKMNKLTQSVNGAIQKFEQVMSTQPTGVGNAINIQREKARQIGYTMDFIAILNSFFQSLKDVTVNMPTLNGVLNDQNMDQNSTLQKAVDGDDVFEVNSKNLESLLAKQLNQAVNGGLFKQAIKGMFSKLGSAIKGIFTGGDENLTAGQPTDQQLLPELKPKSPNETFRFFGTSTEQIVNDIMKMTVGDFKKIMGLAQQLKEPDIQPDNQQQQQTQQQQPQQNQTQNNPDEMQTVKQIVTLSQSLSDDAKQQIVAALTA